MPSPFCSVTSFEQLGLLAELLDGLLAMDYKKLSKIQNTALSLDTGRSPAEHDRFLRVSSM